MPDYNTNAACGWESPEAEAAFNVDIPPDTVQSSAPKAKNPITTAGRDEEITGSEQRAQPETCSVRSTDAGQELCDSHSYAINSTVKVTGIEELGRKDRSTIISWKPTFEAAKGLEGSISEIMERATLARAPLCAIPAPTRTEAYGSTEELFGRIQNAIASQSSQSEQTSALLSYWALSTWFTDGLCVAPSLLIIGPAYEGDLVLRTLRNLCRNPLLMTGITVTALKKVNWRVLPTVLSFSPRFHATCFTFELQHKAELFGRRRRQFAGLLLRKSPLYRRAGVR